MNDARRKELTKAIALIEDAKSILEIEQQGEQEYFDNMPENMQSGDRGQRAEEVADLLSEVVTSCEEAISSVESALE